MQLADPLPVERVEWLRAHRFALVKSVTDAPQRIAPAHQVLVIGLGGFFGLTAYIKLLILGEIGAIVSSVPHERVLDIISDDSWYNILKQWGVREYEGVNISSNSILRMKKDYPDAKFSSVARIEDFKTDKEFDLIFSQQPFLNKITDENLAQAAATLKKIGKKLLSNEPVTARDYSKYFKIEKTLTMKDKTLTLYDLRA